MIVAGMPFTSIAAADDSGVAVEVVLPRIVADDGRHTRGASLRVRRAECTADGDRDADGFEVVGVDGGQEHLVAATVRRHRDPAIRHRGQRPQRLGLFPILEVVREAEKSGARTIGKRDLHEVLEQ